MLSYVILTVESLYLGHFEYTNLNKKCSKCLIQNSFEFMAISKTMNNLRAELTVKLIKIRDFFHNTGYFLMVCGL